MVGGAARQQNAHDVRASKPMGVLYATSPMGADHTAGLKYEMNNEGAVKISMIEQIVNALMDTLGICQFTVYAGRK